MKSPLRLTAATLLLSLLASTALADDITVKDGRVKGLHYDASLPGQAAVFECTASFPQPNATLQRYDWTIDDADATPVSGATVSLKGVGVGIHTVYCTGYFQRTMPPQVSFYTKRTLKVAAIGGPLSLAAKPVPNNPTTYGHNEDVESNPIYLQYFDYSHASPPAFNPGCEQTQDGTAVAPGQLDGTTMTWSYGSLRCPELVADPSANLSSITVQAESALTAPVTIKCHFAYTDPNDATLSGSADDDTASTPMNPSANNSPMMVNQASVHRPQITSVSHSFTRQSLNSSQPDYAPISGTGYSGTYYAGTYYYMLLKDQLGQGMPGAWVNERFPNSYPSGTKINDSNNYWTTTTEHIGDPAGTFNGVDDISRSWTTSYDDDSADHGYWAATQYVDYVHVPIGIFTGTFTIVWTCSLYPHQTAKP